VRIPDPAEGPLALWGFLVADLGDGRAVVFGGTNAGSSGTTFDRTFLYDMNSDPITATEIEASGPEPRYCGCMVYDAKRNVVVMTGGRNLTTPLSVPPETWELDLTGSRWSQVEVPETPQGVIGCVLAYSRHADTTYLFGGAGPEGYGEAIYAYDPAAPAWNLLSARGPSGRYDPIFEPMGDGRELLLFAGSFGAEGSAFYSDLWKFDTDAETWTEIIPREDGPAAPIGRRTPWMRFSEGERGIYVANGYDGRPGPIGDFWYFDFEQLTWSAFALEGGPTERGFSLALPGPAGSYGIMFGGYDGRAPTPELWKLIPTPE
jgi:hypothetical protein